MRPRFNRDAIASRRALAGRADLRRRPARPRPGRGAFAGVLRAPVRLLLAVRARGGDGSRYKTEADCVAFATLATRQQLGTIEGAIAQGRISVDPARAEACVTAYRDRSLQLRRCISPREHRPAAERRRDPRLLPGPAGRPRPDEQGVQRRPGMRAGIALRRRRARAINGGFAGMVGSPDDADDRPRDCACPIKRRASTATHPSDCDRRRTSPAAAGVRLRPGRQDGQPCVVEFDFMTGHDLEQLRRVPSPLLRPASAAAAIRAPASRAIWTGRSVRSRSGAGAVVRHPVRGGLQAPRQRRGRVRRSRHPALPRRSRLPPHAERRHRGRAAAFPCSGKRAPTAAPARRSATRVSAPTPGTLPLGAKCITNADCASLSCTGFLDGIAGLLPADDLRPAAWAAASRRDDVTGFGGKGGIAGSGAGGFVGTGFAGGRGRRRHDRQPAGAGHRRHPPAARLPGSATSPPQRSGHRRLQRSSTARRAADRRHVHLRVARHGLAGPDRDDRRTAPGTSRSTTAGHGRRAVPGVSASTSTATRRDRLHRRDGSHRRPVRHQRHASRHRLHRPVRDQRQRAHETPRSIPRARATPAPTRRRRR